MAKPNYSFEKRQKELAKKKKKEEKRLRKAQGNKPEDFDSAVAEDTPATDAVVEGDDPAGS